MNCRLLPKSPRAHMRYLTALFILALGFICAAETSAIAQVSLTGTSYLENFNAISSGLPNGWTVTTSASASALGTPGATYTSTATTWAATTGQFANMASATGLTSAATSAQQSASTDRDLAIRQTGSFGDAGAAFTFQAANTMGLTGISLSVDLEMLSVQPRSTTWTIRYAVGASPTAFTMLGTYPDPGAFGTTPFVQSLGVDAENQSGPLWIQIAALSATGGTGNRDSFGINNFKLMYTNTPTGQFWDPNGSSGIGGNGTWDTSTAIWNSNNTGTGTNAAFNPAALAVFGGTAGNVTIAAGGITANSGLRFETTGYIIGGDALTIGPGNNISVTNSGDVATINAKISGSSGVVKTGAGTLVLGSSTNDFTGGLTVSDGVLALASDTAAAAGGITHAGGTIASSDSTARTISNSLTLSGVGPFTYGQATGGTGNLTFSGSVDLGAANRTVVINNALTTFSGAVSASSGLAKFGPGTLQFSAVTTSIGPLTISSGLIGIASGSTLNTTAGSGTVQWNAGLTGSGTLVLSISSGSILQLNPTVDSSGFSGPVNVFGLGALYVRSTLSPLGTGTMTVNASGLTLRTFSSVDGTLANPIHLAGGGNNFTLKLGAPSSTTFTVGPIDGTGQIAIETETGGGAGNVILTGHSSYSGQTSLDMASTGNLRLGNDNALPTSSTLIMGATSGFGGNFDLNGHDQEIASLTDGAGLSGRIINDGALAATNTLKISGSDTQTFHYFIQDHDSSILTGVTALERAGSGITALAGGSTYSGGTTISGTSTIVAGVPSAPQSSVTDGSTNTGSAVITLTSTAGLVPGQPVSGDGIPTSTAPYIKSIDSSTQITISSNANAFLVGDAHLTFGATSPIGLGKLTLAGGTFSTAGLAIDVTTGAQPGSLALSSTSTLNLGAASTPTNVKFSNSSANTWTGTLNVSGWTYGTDHLFVGGDNTGLTSTPAGGQLAQIKFADFAKGASISATGELTPQIGDIDQDTLVNVSDISAEMRALANKDAYRAQYFGTASDPAGDVAFILNVNGDQSADNLDVQAEIVLVANLGSGGGSLAAVPEPSTCVLAVTGAVAAICTANRRRQR
jgi:autotransporter-associated beta strand protein